MVAETSAHVYPLSEAMGEHGDGHTPAKAAGGKKTAWQSPGSPGSPHSSSSSAASPPPPPPAAHARDSPSPSPPSPSPPSPSLPPPAGDLYALLNVPRNASPSAVRKAYHRLALRYHPDKAKALGNSSTSGEHSHADRSAAEEEAAERFHAVRVAFEILSHSVRRSVYDAGRFLSLHDLQKNAMYDRPDFDPRWAMGASLPPETYADAFDGRQDRGHNDDGGAPAPVPDDAAAAAAAEAEAETTADGARLLRVPLEQLHRGFEERLAVVRRIETAPGQFSQETVLLTVEGAPGWAAGTRVTFAGAGDEPLDGPAGDVVVEVAEEPHPVFHRDGDDLICQVRVPLLGALFGCTTDVPTLQGETVHVAVDGARPGQILRLRGHGMRRLGGGSRDCGDLIITFQVAMPAHAAEHVWSEEPSRPTNWLEMELQCQHCRQRYIGTENADDACRLHQDELQPAASPGELPVYACCQRPPSGPGCRLLGAHEATEASINEAKAKAAFNALRIVAREGDAYQCAAQLLYCREMSLVTPAALAMKHANFFGLLILLRSGADMPHTQGLEAALRRAAERDPKFSERLLHVLEHDVDMLDIMARMPGACRVAYAQACHKEADCRLAAKLLQHPRVGPGRCAALKQKAATAALLYRCVEQDDEECARLILAAGYPADANDDWRGDTPLLQAIEASRAGMVEVLLRHGADPNREQEVFDEEGEIHLDSRGPLTLAAQTGGTRIVALLLQAGADVDWTSPVDGRTALHHAARLGDSLTARLLVAGGARTSQEDIQGLRPLDLALEANAPRVAAALQQAIVQEALQSMDGLTVVRLLYDHAGVCEKGEEQDLASVRSNLVVLESALRTLCHFSAGFPRPSAEAASTAPGHRDGVSGAVKKQSVGDSAAAPLASALKLYEAWRDSRDVPSESQSMGAAALLALIDAGVLMKTELQLLLDGLVEDEV